MLWTPLFSIKRRFIILPKRKEALTLVEGVGDKGFHKHVRRKTKDSYNTSREIMLKRDDARPPKAVSPDKLHQNLGL